MVVRRLTPDLGTPYGGGVTQRVDVVVIGAGAMGSAAAWQAARSGRSVVVLERFTPGHLVGASHGATRNISAAYPSDLYQGLLTDVRRLWSELEEESGTQLVDWVGLVQHGHQPPLHQLAAVHERHGIRSGFLTADEAHERWSGLRFAGPVLHTLDAGRVRASEALRVLRERAEAHGAEFRYETPVRDLDVDGDRVTVVTDTAEYHPSRVILTAGAWTSKLVPLDVALPPLRVTQEQPAHFAELPGDRSWPSFMQTPVPGLDRDAYWYTPTYGMLTPGEGIKVGWHGVGKVVDPDARDYAYDEVQMDALRRYVSEWIPGADPYRFTAISCTYTTTPSEDFVIDRRGPLVVGAGFSGHGFKFVPTIGRLLADLAGGGTPIPEFALP
jgi:sarcosine oxidase